MKCRKGELKNAFSAFSVTFCVPFLLFLRLVVKCKSLSQTKQVFITDIIKSFRDTVSRLHRHKRENKYFVGFINMKVMDKKLRKRGYSCLFMSLFAFQLMAQGNRVSLKCTQASLPTTLYQVEKLSGYYKVSY